MSMHLSNVHYNLIIYCHTSPTSFTIIRESSSDTIISGSALNYLVTEATKAQLRIKKILKQSLQVNVYIIFERQDSTFFLGLRGLKFP